MIFLRALEVSFSKCFSAESKRFHNQSHLYQVSGNMFRLVSLLVAAALVSQHSGFEANAQIDNSGLTLDNNLQPNVAPPQTRRRRIGPFVRITGAPDEVVKRAVGDMTELVCTVMAKPKPSIRWLKNGELVQDYDDEVNEILPTSDTAIWTMVAKLVITSRTPGDDKYTCVATVGNKEEFANSFVYTVQLDEEEASLSPQQQLSPMVTYYADGALAAQHSGVLLPCRALRARAAHWLDSRDRLVRGDRRMKVLPSGDLLIRELLWEDMGNFTCVVKNRFGKDAVSTFIYPLKPQV